MKSITIIVFLLITVGCDKLFDEGAKNLLEPVIDCYTSFFTSIEGPVAITTEIIETGSLGINYSQIIRSEIKQEPDDNKYTYIYTYDNNELPSGLTYRANDRQLIIEGTPQETGNFIIGIKVHSPTLKTMLDDYDTSCVDSSEATASKTFYLTIK